LIQAAESEGFDLLVVCERNLQLPGQSKRHLAILEFYTSFRPTLERKLPLIRLHANTMKPGEFRVMAEL